MTVERVRPTYLHTCDACGGSTETDNEFLPTGWAQVHLSFEKAPEGMTSSVTEHDLCHACAADIAYLYVNFLAVKVPA
jgi:hypothetical protein